MYITAQRVRSPKRKEGINSFLHLHGLHFEWPQRTDHLVGLPDTNPGKLIATNIEVKPGGNDVLSYLDVIAPDGTDPGRLITALDELRKASIHAGMFPVALVIGDVLVRLGLIPAYEEHWLSEIETLSRRFTELLDRVKHDPDAGRKKLSFG